MTRVIDWDNSLCSAVRSRKTITGKRTLYGAHYHVEFIEGLNINLSRCAWPFWFIHAQFLCHVTSALTFQGWTICLAWWRRVRGATRCEAAVMLFIELHSRRLDGSILLLSRITLHHSLYFPPVSLYKVVILHSHLLRDLIFWSVSAHLYFPFLQSPIFFFFLTLSCNHFSCFSAPTSLSASLPPHAHFFFNRYVFRWRLLLPAGLWKCQKGPLHFLLRK